jgi:hypothetical protein
MRDPIAAEVRGKIFERLRQEREQLKQVSGLNLSEVVDRAERGVLRNLPSEPQEVAGRQAQPIHVLFNACGCHRINSTRTCAVAQTNTFRIVVM